MSTTQTDADLLRWQIHDIIATEVFERQGVLMGCEWALNRIMSLPAIATPATDETARLRATVEMLVEVLEFISREGVGPGKFPNATVRRINDIAQKALAAAKEVTAP